MHISLTPKLEPKIQNKVSEVREALSFMDKNEETVQQMKLNHLHQTVAISAEQVESGQLSSCFVDDIIADLNNA
ncbi:MAG TPA: type II toxin-antitoxin system ParD family antitoxin [Ghiorsea sp.]|nr:type II toxin-antitoxin system ParD family antitoxin [Ghiorsea sp.]HIP07271.1 type II toxin-antitoxin system ParD family antitoxin [Mariprofundaceae bacterium]